MTDKLLGVILAAGLVYYLRNTVQLLPWIFVSALVSYNYIFKKCVTLSLLFGVGVGMAVLHLSTCEHFEQEKLDKKKEEDKDEPEPTGKTTPHVDLGTTILHAYRNLTPEQIGGMRKDTKELMELQKELMGTLAEMKPAIEQGAELLGTFSQFFGSPQA